MVDAPVTSFGYQLHIQHQQMKALQDNAVQMTDALMAGEARYHRPLPTRLALHPLKQASKTTSQPYPPFLIRYTRCRACISAYPIQHIPCDARPAFLNMPSSFADATLQSLRSRTQSSFASSGKKKSRPSPISGRISGQAGPFPWASTVPCLANPPCRHPCTRITVLHCPSPSH